MATKVTYIKTSSVSKKLLQLLIAIALVIFTLSLWADIKTKGNDLLAENAIVLADNLLQQTGHSAAYYILKGDTDALAVLTESALVSENIYEMLIYNKYGELLSKSENAIPAKERFINISTELQKFLPTPYVIDVKSKTGDLLGFIRVTVLTKNLQRSGISYIYTMTKQVLLIMLLSGFIGYLLTNGLKPFSANAYMVKD
ncbi:AhpA/YtjB family protein [Psychrosphaera aestuarii]|uniref:AhpA/YtjB family protein n=1 Tax=Psychrosphaera aestuarii TaxID=1266052 RepID=UPI001B33FB2F|nr:AhpA/YtjB family protein [Psychrosphaera aestuarii]